MNNLSSNQIQNDLIRVLGKGMVTIPKDWRDDLGISTGDFIKACKNGKQVILEPIEDKIPYRVYTQNELEQFIKEDQLPRSLEKKVNKKYPPK